MGKVWLRFITDPGISSWAIRWFTWSEWSHVDLVLRDGRFLGARIEGGMGVGKQEHEKNHPNVNEMLRMHEENRELMQHIMDLLQKNNLTRETDFRHLNERIDRMMEKK